MTGRPRRSLEPQACGRESQAAQGSSGRAPSPVSIWEEGGLSMTPMGRVPLLWGLLLMLSLLLGRAWVANRAFLLEYQARLAERQAVLESQQAQLRLQQAQLQEQRAELEALRGELDELRSTLEATQERLREYEAYYERIRPIAARLRPAKGADPWAIAAQI